MVIGIELMLVVIFCVLIGVNSFVIGRRTAPAKTAEADAAARDDEVEILAAAMAKAQSENEALRDRLEVLERLATDEDAKLAREIDKLRRRENRRGEDDDRPGA